MKNKNCESPVIKKAYDLFKEKIKGVPYLERLFENKKAEDIKDIWKEYIKFHRLPVVISFPPYIYGIGGIIESQNKISTPKEILTPPFFYSSIIEEGVFRDIFYFIHLINKLEAKLGKEVIFNFLFETYIKNKKIKKIYDELVAKLNFKEKMDKIALIIQLIYSFFSKEEIEKFYDNLIEKSNEEILNSIREWQEIFPEWYDAFYLAYKDEEDNKEFINCYIITKYGVIKDISFRGKKVEDPVKLLSEKIAVYMEKDDNFKLRFEEEIKERGYSEDLSMVDKIYEYIMEIPDLTIGKLKDHFSPSTIIYYIFEETIPNSEKIKKVIFELEKERSIEILYYLILLALGFEVPCVRIEYEKLNKDGIIRRIQNYYNEISGVISHEERKERICENLKKLFLDFEYFLSYFTPFIVSYKICGGKIQLLKDKRQEIQEEFSKGKKLTLGELINILEKKNVTDKDIINKLKKINEYRNQLSHPRPEEIYKKFTQQEFKKICDTLKEIYEKMFNKFQVFIIEIKQIVEDSHARKYIYAEEYGIPKKWYITFENEKIYEEIDPTYLHYIISHTNPVARDPFLFPITPSVLHHT
ncbi:MAG: hypothetical protein ABDH37_07940 [Candidatus Hydrothermales bacterium]